MKKIESIAFYEREKNGEKVREACVFYENGKYKILSYEDGQKETIRYARENNFKSINELKLYGDVNTFSEEEFMCTYPEIAEKVFANDSNKLNKLSKIIDSIKNKKKTKKTKKSTSSGVVKTIKRKFKRLAIFAGILFLASSSYKLVKNSFNNDSDKNIESDKDSEKDAVKNKKYDNIYDLLYDIDANINMTKKSAISSITSYLTNYNLTFANDYVDSKTNTKLAHTWDEALVNYLAYNNLSQEEVNQIFDTYSLDLQKLEKAYESSIKQDVLACTVMTSSTGKEKLIISNKGQDFYTKYEKMMITYNSKVSANTYENKVKIAENFYKTVKKDFYLNTDDKKEIADYKLSVIPIIKTFNNLTKNMDLENKLDSDEKDYIDCLSDFDYVYKKIAGYKNKLDSYNKASKSLGEESSEISYEELKELVIDELKSKDCYNVANSERNIKDNEDYQKNIEESKKKVTNVSTSTNNSNSNSNNNSTTKSTSNSDNDNKEDDTNKTNNKKKEKSKKTVEKEDTTTAVDEIKNTSDESFKEITNDSVTDEENKEDTTTEESVEEWHEITEEDNTQSFDDSTVSVEEVDENLEDTVVENAEIKEEFIDSNGNLDDSVKDITTDSTGSVSSDTELPDPNNEEETITDNQVDYEAVAEQIVEDMANDTSENFTEVKVLTK